MPFEEYKETGFVDKIIVERIVLVDKLVAVFDCSFDCCCSIEVWMVLNVAVLNEVCSFEVMGLFADGAEVVQS